MIVYIRDGFYMGSICCLGELTYYWKYDRSSFGVDVKMQSFFGKGHIIIFRLDRETFGKEKLMVFGGTYAYCLYTSKW